MSAGGGGGGGSTPEWITALSELGQRAKTMGLTGAILSFVLPALVSMFILSPLRYGIGFIEWAGALIQGVFTTVEETVTTGLKPVQTALLGSSSTGGVFDMVYSSVETALMDAGLGAPFAATLTVVVFASVLTVLLYVVFRVSADLLPGVGGLIR